MFGNLVLIMIVFSSTKKWKDLLTVGPTPVTKIQMTRPRTAYKINCVTHCSSPIRILQKLFKANNQGSCRSTELRSTEKNITLTSLPYVVFGEMLLRLGSNSAHQGCYLFEESIRTNGFSFGISSCPYTFFKKMTALQLITSARTPLTSLAYTVFA